MRWWDVRCKLSAGSFKPGHCHGLLFRINGFGDLEMKCHKCHKIQVVSRDILDSYRMVEMATT